MSAILSVLGWFFRFELWERFVGLVFKTITFGKMVLVNTALVVAIIAYGGAVLKLLLFVYEKTNYLITYINKMTSGTGDEILIWAMDVIKAFGIWNAFVDVYNVFSVPIISIFTIFAMRLVLKVLHSLQRTLVAYSVARM